MGLDGLPATSLGALKVLKKVPKDRFVLDLDEAKVVARKLLDLDS